MNPRRAACAFPSEERSPRSLGRPAIPAPAAPSGRPLGVALPAHKVPLWFRIATRTAGGRPGCLRIGVGASSLSMATSRQPISLGPRGGKSWRSAPAHLVRLQHNPLGLQPAEQEVMRRLPAPITGALSRSSRDARQLVADVLQLSQHHLPGP